jgi:hypothetical protein
MERGEKSFSALLGLLLEAYQACFYKEQYKIIWPNTERIMTWNTLKNYRLIIENQIEKIKLKGLRDDVTILSEMRSCMLK